MKCIDFVYICMYDIIRSVLHTLYSLFQVNIDNLAYKIEDFEGELYRMNLSCFQMDRSSPESGCLFFKVFGMSNIAKFNGQYSCLSLALKCLE